MRSLGIIVYPDGSQAELFAMADYTSDRETGRTFIKPLAKPRKLKQVFE